MRCGEPFLKSTRLQLRLQQPSAARQWLEEKGPVDDRTFNGKLSNHGAAKFKKKLTNKLKEYMGDYMDETLVQYVTILLKNGKGKERAKTELKVFLGDHSESFVAWLWDHLAKHGDEYFTSHVEKTTIKSSLIRHESEDKAPVHMDSGSKEDHEQIRDRKSLSNRKRSRTDDSSNEQREAKADEPSLKRRSVVSASTQDSSDPDQARSKSDIVGKENIKPYSTTKKSVTSGESRSQPTKVPKLHSLLSSENQKVHNSEKEVLKQRPDRKSSTPQMEAKPDEPSLKLRCSVVSASTQDSSEPNQARRNSSVMNPLATVDGGKLIPLKAVTQSSMEKSDIVGKENIKPTVSVNEDLTTKKSVPIGELRSQEANGPEIPPILSSEDQKVHNSKNEDLKQRDDRKSTSPQSLSNRKRSRPDDSSNEQLLHSSMQDDLATSELSVCSSEPPLKRLRSVSTQDSSDPNQAQETSSVMDEGKLVSDKAITQSSTEKILSDTIGKENVEAAVNVNDDSTTKKSVPKTSPTIRPLEDASSRTIFVSNVHFGATMKEIVKYFYKFGEVNKAEIVTNPVTGRPTGSAYIEFMSEESADKTLAQKGLIFMFRKLEVVKGSMTTITQLSTENISSDTIGTENINPAVNVQEASTSNRSDPSVLSTFGALEDASLRSIFVANVHFDATVDDLTRFFNKIGPVFNVDIVKDPVTKAPQGSAYIVFTYSEDANKALGLNGASFMTRYLKIIKGSRRQQVGSSSMTWSRGRRFTRASSYGRGGAEYRGYPSFRGGAAEYRGYRGYPGFRGGGGEYRGYAGFRGGAFRGGSVFRGRGRGRSM